MVVIYVHLENVCGSDEFCGFMVNGGVTMAILLWSLYEYHIHIAD